ncbi:MAG: RagB/SusD family nutrient uptake outer membrane protein [Bacteroidales bacterium]|nr:RagB/SusD family nutrient uptake outer membrane protein [Bacteroidales bacterium]
MVIGLLYLRYAEAVNRAGKPNLAFAVLKNGLTATTLSDESIVPQHEKGTVLPSYMNFTPSRFDASNITSSYSTIGIHGRGNGNIHLATDFRIPSLPTLQDSILYVEDKIVEELALETAFEGNRFHDLMRVAKRRNNPGYLAEKVAEKYNDRAAIETLLRQESNWYLPVY